MVTDSDEGVYISGVIKTGKNECISGSKRNATKTTMHSMSPLHHTAGEANANILCFDGGGTGTGSCFGIPGDDDAETMRAVQSSIPGGVGGDAVDAGDVDVE